MQLIATLGLVPVPWKNGGGVTREIATRSDAAGLLWRLSLAEIDRDGPFSAFPGFWRILTVVAGPGLALDFGAGRRCARPLEPLAFDGGSPVRAHLRGGPVRALNVIWRPDAVAAGVQPRRGPARASLAAAAGGAVALCALAGSCRADGIALPAGTVALAAALRVDLAAGAVALLVRLDRPAPAPAAVADGNAEGPPDRWPGA